MTSAVTRRPRAHQIYIDQQAIDIQLNEGHGAGDVKTELNGLVRSGLCRPSHPRRGC